MIVNRHLSTPLLALKKGLQVAGHLVFPGTYIWIPLPTRCFTTASLELSKLQRRRDRLRGLLRRIKFPPLEWFNVDGVNYPLPLRAVPPPEQQPTREELEYLCGFFDGDGCVTMVAKTGVSYLKVVQSINNAHILLRFRHAFGGGVYVGDQRTGFSQTTLRWQVGSKSAFFVSGLMASVPSMKQDQLEVVASGNVEAVNRSKVQANLKTMKQKGYIPTSLAVTWRYFAGFFDAEGCISAAARSGSLHLAISQVNPTVLESLLAFLQDQGLDRWKLGHSSKASHLQCWHLETCKLTLKHLLQNGLSVKGQQAEIALELSPSNRQTIRDKLFCLTGRQGRYVRLDEAGCLRAKEIKKFRGQWHKSRCAEKRKQVEVELMRRQEEHAFARLAAECQTLRSDIRMMLSDGGHVPESSQQVCSEKEPDMGTYDG